MQTAGKWCRRKTSGHCTPPRSFRTRSSGTTRAARFEAGRVYWYPTTRSRDEIEESRGHLRLFSKAWHDCRHDAPGRGALKLSGEEQLTCLFSPAARYHGAEHGRHGRDTAFAIAIAEAFPQFSDTTAPQSEGWHSVCRLPTLPKSPLCRRGSQWPAQLARRTAALA